MLDGMGGGRRVGGPLGLIGGLLHGEGPLGIRGRILDDRRARIDNVVAARHDMIGGRRARMENIVAAREDMLGGGLGYGAGGMGGRRRLRRPSW